MDDAIVQQIDALVSQLQQEGILDEQFEQLMQLQDSSNPDFVAEVVQLYFEDSVIKMDKLSSLLLSGSPPDFGEVDQLVHQLKGSSASLGARQMATLCSGLREGCQLRDAGRCQHLLMQLRDSFARLKACLDIFMGLEAQRH